MQKIEHSSSIREIEHGCQSFSPGYNISYFAGVIANQQQVEYFWWYFSLFQFLSLLTETNTLFLHVLLGQVFRISRANQAARPATEANSKSMVCFYLYWVGWKGLQSRTAGEYCRLKQFSFDNVTFFYFALFTMFVFQCASYNNDVGYM